MKLGLAFNLVTSPPELAGTTRVLEVEYTVKCFTSLCFRTLAVKRFEDISVE